MKLEVERFRLRIIPESALDEAYLEEVLCLMKDGDSVPMVRRNVTGLSCWAHAEICEVEPQT